MMELENVSLSFGEKHVINDFSFTLERGERIAIMGDSGAGKTTLMRILLGLLKPDSGSVEIDDRLSVLFQENRLIESLSVISNLMLVTDDRERALDMLERVGLRGEGKNRVSTLSGGMKRRLSLARALLVPYDTLLLDEPFNGLDPERKHSIAELILSETEGKGIILISHEEEERELLGVERRITIA